MLLLISYDLNGHERPSAYTDVRDMIEEHALDARRPLYSQWMVETDDSVELWHERMRTVNDTGDRWFIVKVTKPRQGWLSSDDWEWIRAAE